MHQKIEVETSIDDLYSKEHELGQSVDKTELNQKFDEIVSLDKKLAKLIKEYESHFNETWGEVMRAGAEPSALLSSNPDHRRAEAERAHTIDWRRS